MGNFQEVFLIILSLFANFNWWVLFIHEKFLVYKLETFKNCTEVKQITIIIIALTCIFFILRDIWSTVENYFQKFFRLLCKSPSFCQHWKFFRPTLQRRWEDTVRVLRYLLESQNFISYFSTITFYLKQWNTSSPATLPRIWCSVISYQGIKTTYISLKIQHKYRCQHEYKLNCENCAFAI